MRNSIAACVLITVLPVSAETLPADPTRPAAAALQMQPLADPAQKFTLTGLMTGKQRNSAVINGQPVLVGDSVDGAMVLAIEATGVTLATGSGEQFIAPGERKGFSKVKRGE